MLLLMGNGDKESRDPNCDKPGHVNNERCENRTSPRTTPDSVTPEITSSFSTITGSETNADSFSESTNSPSTTNFQTESPNKDKSVGFSVMEYLGEHWFYFAMGIGCLLLVIIILCTIVCYSRRLRNSLKRQLSKLETVCCEERKEIPNGKLAVEPKNKALASRSNVDNNGRLSNYDVILDINTDGAEDDTVMDKCILGYDKKESLKENGSMKHSSLEENGNNNEPLQKKTNALNKDDNYFILEKAPSVEQSSPASETKRGDKHAKEERKSEDIKELRADSKYDVLHMTPKHQLRDGYDHIELTNLTSFKENGGIQEAEVCTSDTYDHLTSRKF